MDERWAREAAEIWKKPDKYIENSSSRNQSKSGTWRKKQRGVSPRGGRQPQPRCSPPERDEELQTKGPGAPSYCNQPLHLQRKETEWPRPHMTLRGINPHTTPLKHGPQKGNPEPTTTYRQQRTIKPITLATHSGASDKIPLLSRGTRKSIRHNTILTFDMSNVPTAGL